jgi:hypothetical protein
MNGDDQQKPEQPQPPAPDVPAQPPAPAPQWQFTSDDEPAPLAPAATQSEDTQQSLPEVSWTASEFIAHQKTAKWYGVLAFVTAVTASGVYLLTRDYISAGVVVVLALLFGVTAGRKPRVLSYHLDSHGLTVGRQSYPYGLFKAFAVVDEGAFSSIVLLPLKRFNLPISIYFSPEDEQKVLDVLSQQLPVAEHNDPFDSLLRRIKF